jgi:hypothetical protein
VVMMVKMRMMLVEVMLMKRERMSPGMNNFLKEMDYCPPIDWHDWACLEIVVAMEGCLG